MKMNDTLVLAILKQFSKFKEINFVDCEIEKSFTINFGYIVNQQYNIREIYINNILGIDIYNFLQTISKNKNVKHDLKYCYIYMLISNQNHDISNILKIKSLNFNQCRFGYYKEFLHYLELFSPKITSGDLKFIKLNMTINYVVHNVALKSG